jgi:hypothetical protein
VPLPNALEAMVSEQAQRVRAVHVEEGRPADELRPGSDTRYWEWASQAFQQSFHKFLAGVVRACICMNVLHE